ncbi:hypothetical protein ACLOJK_005739 [Asimina triloba]
MEKTLRIFCTLVLSLNIFDVEIPPFKIPGRLADDDALLSEPEKMPAAEQRHHRILVGALLHVKFIRVVDEGFGALLSASDMSYISLLLVLKLKIY